MLRRFFGFAKDEVIMPSMGRKEHQKVSRLAVIKIKVPEDISDLRGKAKEFDILLINISKLFPGEEQNNFVRKLKLVANDHNSKVYGVDRNWLLITKYPLESS